MQQRVVSGFSKCCCLEHMAWKSLNKQHFSSSWFSANSSRKDRNTRQCFSFEGSRVNNRSNWTCIRALMSLRHAWIVQNDSTKRWFVVRFGSLFLVNALGGKGRKPGRKGSGIQIAERCDQWLIVPGKGALFLWLIVIRYGILRLPVDTVRVST